MKGLPGRRERNAPAGPLRAPSPRDLDRHAPCYRYHGGPAPGRRSRPRDRPGEDPRWDAGPFREAAMLVVVTVLFLCAVAAAAGTLAICREDR